MMVNYSNLDVSLYFATPNYKIEPKIKWFSLQAPIGTQEHLQNALKATSSHYNVSGILLWLFTMLKNNNRNNIWTTWTLVKTTWSCCLRETTKASTISVSLMPFSRYPDTFLVNGQSSGGCSKFASGSSGDGALEQIKYDFQRSISEPLRPSTL